MIYSYINDIYPEEIRWLGFIINYVFAKIGEMSLSMICENVDQYYVNFGYIVLCCSCLFLGYFLKDSNGYEKEGINDINFYEAAGLDTWIGGDNNSSEYYFDYEGDSVILKSINKNPITFNLSQDSGGYYLIKTDKNTFLF